MSMEKLNQMNGAACPCGKPHHFDAKVIIERGAIKGLPAILENYEAKKVYLLSDRNTYRAAGEKVRHILEERGIKVNGYMLDEDCPEPDEKSVGAAILHYEVDCDAVIGVGSGVINDIGKIVAAVSGKPYIIVGTAPSMDGYASASSSMTRDGLKISLPSTDADYIIGDLEILCQAPMKLMISGLGDMIAKYVSICEWRIAHLIMGEYYCEEIAALIRSAVQKCVSNAKGLLQREEQAVRAVFEGLVIGGVAMNYAGLSRPASGVEHYISHVYDMRGVNGHKIELHGIQCAIGTVIAVGLYHKLKEMTPDREKALSYVAAFDYSKWAEELRLLLGKGAESMIALEQKEQKYHKEHHKERLEIILSHWEEILEILSEELPCEEELCTLLQTIGAPITLEEAGLDASILPTAFKATKDIRDKYVLSRLAWDLGVLDELADTL